MFRTDPQTKKLTELSIKQREHWIAYAYDKFAREWPQLQKPVPPTPYNSPRRTIKE